MKTITENKISPTQWIANAEELAQVFRSKAAHHDQTASFVKANYDLLKVNRFFSVAIPEELGGAGLEYKHVCQIIRIFGQACGSTALAFSMHQHLVAANIWKYKLGRGGAPILKRVANEQLVLVSTGARDWLESNGTMEKVPGGYLLTAKKAFASQSVIGDILVTSAPYRTNVLHFPVPMTAEGIEIENDWQTLGMRGTGSCTVMLNKVFIREGAIAVKRLKGEYAPLWNVVLTVALPYIMSAYVGIAERAAELALQSAKTKAVQKPHLPYLAGEMNNELVTAQVMLNDMIRICNNYNFEPKRTNGNAMLSRKTIITKAVKQVVAKAMELSGGQSFFKRSELERLSRDIQAAHFHPLPEKEQQLFTGSFLLAQ